MYKTLTALAGAALLLGASAAQAELTLSDTEANQVTAAGSFGDFNDVDANINNGFNGSFNDFFNDFSVDNGNNNTNFQ